MKAFIASAQSIVSTPYPVVRMIADSAIAPDREPLWLDLDGEPVVALLCPAWRVGRLGRNIKPQFAHRYIDALCTCAVVLPQSWADRPLEVPEILFARTEAVICSPDVTVQELPAGSFAERAVTELSRFMILKNGDRFIDVSQPRLVALSPGQNIRSNCGAPGAPDINLRVR